MVLMHSNFLPVALRAPQASFDHEIEQLARGQKIMTSYQGYISIFQVSCRPQRAWKLRPDKLWMKKKI